MCDSFRLLFFFFFFFLAEGTHDSGHHTYNLDTIKSDIHAIPLSAVHTVYTVTGSDCRVDAVSAVHRGATRPRAHVDVHSTPYVILYRDARTVHMLTSQQCPLPATRKVPQKESQRPHTPTLQSSHLYICSVRSYPNSKVGSYTSTQSPLVLRSGWRVTCPQSSLGPNLKRTSACMH